MNEFLTSALLTSACLLPCWSTEVPCDGSAPITAELGEYQRSGNALLERLDIQCDLCLQHDEVAHALRIVELEYGVNPALAMIMKQVVYRQAHRERDLGAACRADFARIVAESDLLTGLMVQGLLATGSAHDALADLEAQQGSIPRDIYLKFHSGLLLLDGDKQGAAREWALVPMDVRQRITCHPLVSGSF